MMFRALIAAMIGLAALLSACSVRAADEPSAAVVLACGPDVLRLCPVEAARNRPGIPACMKAHAAQVSAACKAAWGSR